MKSLIGTRIVALALVTFLTSVVLVNGAALGTRNVTDKGKAYIMPWPTLDGSPPDIVSHRGEKVYMPEHTEAAYELAALEGADYVEPDLMLTKDGVLVCFHDLTLGTTTDAPVKFPEKRTNFSDIIDENGELISYTNEWLIKDFDLEELRNLTVKQKVVGARPQLFNAIFKIPTFEEYLATVHHAAYKMNKTIGIIPELKHPLFHNRVIFNASGPGPMEDLFLSTLHSWGYNVFGNSSLPTNPCISTKDSNNTIACGPLVLQSFEISCVKDLKAKTKEAGLDVVMLIDNPHYHLLTRDGIKEVPEYADYLAPWKELLYKGIEKQMVHDNFTWNQTLVDQLGGFIPPEDLVSEAHKLGLKVSIYTIYDSKEPSQRGCTELCDIENKMGELYYYFNLGVDNLFVENVPEATQLRTLYEYEKLHRGSGTYGKHVHKFLITATMFLTVFNGML